jgi:SOS-response transcriptional repressor LexA
MLTAKQRRALWFIQEWITEHHGVSPTYEQMRLGLGYASKSHIHRIILSLVERGYIKRIPNRWQSLIVAKKLEPKYFVFDDETKELRPVSTVVRTAHEKKAEG